MSRSWNSRVTSASLAAVWLAAAFLLPSHPATGRAPITAWRLAILYPPGADNQNAGAQPALMAPFRAQLAGHLGDRLRQMGVSASANDSASGFRVDLSGSGGQEQLRALLHAGSAEYQYFNPISLPSTLRLAGSVQQGEQWVFALDAGLTSGYSWALVDGGGLVEQIGTPLYQTVMPGRIGAAVREEITLKATGSGQAEILLAYRRPFNPNQPSQMELTLTVDRLALLTDLSNPFAVPDLRLPDPAVELAPQTARSASAALPAAYNYAALGLVTPVRDQGDCGSCWAFATVGPLESAILRKDGLSVDLSEQYLISCNSRGWNCAYGGLEAHDYHLQNGEFVDPQTESGAVLESAMPYLAQDTSCPAPAAHPYKIESWHYVSMPGVVPPTDTFKQELLDYGPIDISLCAGSAFQVYTGGLFQTDESNQCGSGLVNHDVTLVGWDDNYNNSGVGVWIIKNEWSTGWGMAGYMAIKWGVSNIGTWASAVDYAGRTPAAPALLSPASGAGLPTGQSITFSWGTVSGASQYRVEITGPSGTGSQTVTSAWQAGTSYAAAFSLAGSYTWRAQGKSAAGVEGTWSASQPFTLYVLPPAPALSSPADGAAFPPGAVTLAISPVAGMSQYLIEISGTLNAGGAFSATSGWTTSTSYQTASLQPGSYQWRAKTRSALTESAYSAYRSFKVVLTPHAPAFVFPTQGLKLPAGVPIQIRWNADPNSTKYMLVIYNGSTLATSTLVITSPWIATTSWVTSLPAAGSWHMRIKGANPLDETQDYGAAIDFSAYTPKFIWLPMLNK